MLSCLKAGDSCSWFTDRTYYFKLPIHSRGTYLPKRFPLGGVSILTKRTVELAKESLGLFLDR